MVSHNLVRGEDMQPVAKCGQDVRLQKWTANTQGAFPTIFCNSNRTGFFGHFIMHHGHVSTARGALPFRMEPTIQLDCSRNTQPGYASCINATASQVESL